MNFGPIKLPRLVFFYAAIVLTAVLCICMFYLQKEALEDELLKWQEEAQRLKNELERIKRYTEIYQTSPEIIALVLRESEKYKIDPTMMLELIKLESKFTANAISPHGAIGLCQIRPETAEELARELGLPPEKELLFNAEYNIKLGTYFLSKLLDIYDKDYHKALTAYNRGPAGLLAYMKKRGTAVSTYSRRISEGLALNTY
ncbi:MAG: Lytic transglycosylase catalytic [Peptococcaceae bacterium]|jgi:soluble lytic murein transglycosylase-like protein|nr:Lytic transglycosylase catalytic [Peptococcaceae bacterium]